MLRDRGNKKWTAMMLPEHVANLRQFASVDYYRQPQPTLDDDAIEEMERIIAGSMEENTELRFTVWRDGFTSELVGRVHFVDVVRKELRVKDAEDCVHKIPFDNLVKVTYNN